MPPLDETGNLPAGIHSATLTEVVTYFGATRGRRGVCTQRLSHIYRLAQRTEHLQRFLIFGSYVTSEAAPNDVDVVLVMDDAFRWEECPLETRGLFDHAAAQARYGASIFWIRPSLLIRESVEGCLAA